MAQPKFSYPVAQILEFGISDMIPQAELEGLGNQLRVTEHMDHLMRRMVYTLRTRLATNTKEESRTNSVHVIKTPKSVWQMFKQVYLPAWFVAWFPVRYSVTSVPTVIIIQTTTRICPHIDVSRSRSWDHVDWVTFNHDPKFCQQ